MDWRKHVVEVKDRARLVELIESGGRLISGVAALRGLPLTSRMDTIDGLQEAQAAYRAQLAELDAQEI
jgi:hypothetical protein